MNYVQLTIQGQTAAVQEQLIAVLSEQATNGFEERDDSLLVYFAQDAYTATTEQLVTHLQQQYNLTIDHQTIRDQNWNAQWESDYRPVVVADFCAIRATFHPPISTVQHELIVTPKMSFGTGHHATTYMMLQQLRQLTIADQYGLDYGCGTGVLAILAHRLGAAGVDAVDIDKWAYQNTLENIDLNQVQDRIQVYEGLLEVVPMRQYHFILANINRNDILDTLPDMVERLYVGGYLLTSGFLEQDVPLIVDKAASLELQKQQLLQREQWCCLLFMRQ